MIDTMKTYVVYHTVEEGYLGQKRMDKYTVIGGHWYPPETKIFYENGWGLRIIDIKDYDNDVDYKYQMETKLEIANLVWGHQRHTNYNGIVFVPVTVRYDDNDAPINDRVMDMNPNFFEGIDYVEFLGIGETMGLKAPGVDQDPRYVEWY